MYESTKTAEIIKKLSVFKKVIKLSIDKPPL